MIDQFSREQFEQVLSDAGFKFDDLGWIQGERCFAISLDASCSIRIRSSIRLDGQSAKPGEDSIRCYLLANGKPIVGKETIQSDRWTTRQPGWQTRLIEKVEQLRIVYTRLGTCQKCGSPNLIARSHSKKNYNRIYISCSRYPACDGWGRWVDNLDAFEQTLNQKSLFDSAPTKTDSVSVAVGAESSAPTDAATDSQREPVAASANGLVFLTDLANLEEDVKVAPVVVKKEFRPSIYNEAILDAFLHTDHHLQIKARAGSGKTSQNIWLLSFIPEKSIDVEMLVFGKNQQLDMVERVPEWMKERTRTSHAFGFDMVCKHFGIKNKRDFAERSQRKTWDLFKANFPYGSVVQNDYAPINKLLSLCKNSLREPSKENLDYLCERFDIVTNGNTDAIYDAVATLWQASIDSLQRMCDMDDMLFAPAYGLVPVEKRDLLFVDEYQDNNDAQRALYLKTGARIVYVGDEFQSIYGFRGAMLGAMQEMEKHLDAMTLPLPISYRCAKSIIALAQTIVPDILPRKDAPEGLVSYTGKLEMVKSGDAVLCRNNAYLVEPCFRLIRDGIKATIRGRDIGTNLMNLVKRVEKKTFSSSFIHLLSAIQDYTDTESGKLEIAHKENQAASLRDQCETIMVLADACHSTKDLSDKVDTIFSDRVEGVVFSTVHKYKGLESQRIFVLKPELLTAQKYDTKEWQLEQLRNLTYVAYTRAMNELYFVKG